MFQSTNQIKNPYCLLLQHIHITSFSESYTLGILCGQSFPFNPRPLPQPRKRERFPIYSLSKDKDNFSKLWRGVIKATRKQPTFCLQCLQQLQHRKREAETTCIKMLHVAPNINIGFTMSPKATTEIFQTDSRLEPITLYIRIHWDPIISYGMKKNQKNLACIIDKIWRSTERLFSPRFL